MADYQSTIELKAVTRDIDRKLNTVKKNLRGVSKQVKKAQISFTKMSRSSISSLKKLDAKVKSSKLAIAGFAASFALIAVQGVKAFKDWEDGLNQIATLGVKKMGMVIDQLKSLRREYGITGKEATKGYYDIVSAGAKAGKQAMDQLTAATQLAKAGNTDLDKAVKIVTSGVKVFGEQGETATSIIDKLFLAVKYGKTTVAELGNQFGLVAPIMKSAGLGMSDYGAAMAAITAGSIETTVATTGLKAIMSNIVKVTPKAEKAAARLGIEFNVAALKAKGFVGFMQDIKEKTGGSIVEIGLLFESIEAINAVAVLTSDAGIADLIRNFAAMKDSAGTVKEAMDIIRKSFSFNWGVLTQQMKIMTESIGSSLVPALISFASALSPIIELISALILEHPGIVKLTAAVMAFGLAWAFIGAPAALAITGIIAAMKFASNYFELFADGGAHAFNVIGDHIRRLAILLGRGPLVQGFKAIYDTAVSWLTKTTTHIKDIKWASVIFDGLNTAIEKIKTWFDDLWTYLIGGSVIPKIVNGINEWFSSTKLTFVATLEKLILKAEGLFDRLYAAVQKGSSDGGDILGLEDAAGSTDALNTAGAGIVTILKGISVAIANVDLSKLQKLIQSARELAAAVSDDFARDVSTDAKQGARALENAAVGRTSFIQQRIKDIRTLGKEIGDLKLKAVNAEIEKLFRNLETEGKIKARGVIGQFLYGDDLTLLSFGEKTNALFIRIDGLVIKLIRRLDTALMRFDAIGTKAAAVDLSKGITPDANITETDKKGKETTRARTVEEIKAGNYKWFQALKQALKSFDTAVSGRGLRLQAISVLLEATYVKISNGLSRFSATLGAMGRFLAKIPGLSSLAPGAILKTITNTKIFRAVAFIGKKILIPLIAIHDAYKGFTDLDRISEITGIDTSGIKTAEENLYAAQDILDTMAAGTRIYSDQQGRVDILAKAVADAESDAGLTTGKRSISAAANAIGNFFSGFAHLGGIVADFADLGLTADVLKGVDFAPTFRKVFEIFVNLFETFKNMFANDEDGAGILDTALSSLLAGALNTIIGAVDIIHKVSMALKALSEGDIFGVVKHLSRAIKTIFNYIVSILPWIDFDELQVADQKKYDATDADDARDDAKDRVDDLTDELSDLTKGTEDFARKQAELMDAQRKLTTASEKAAIALAKIDEAQAEFIRDGRKNSGFTSAREAVSSNNSNIAKGEDGSKYTWSTGGPISGAGSSTSDSIPAMLSNGEFVINAKAAGQNRALLEQINSGKIAKFAKGGEVGGNGSLFANITGAASKYTSSFIENQLENLSGYNVPGRVMGFFGGLISAADGLMSSIMPKVNSMFTTLFNSDVPQTRATNLIRDKAEPQVYDYLGRYGDDVVDQLTVSKGLSYIPGVGTILALANAASIPMELLQGYSKSQRVLGRYRGLPNFANSFLEGFEGASSPTDYFRMLTGGKSISRALIDSVTSFFQSDDAPKGDFNKNGIKAMHVATGGSIAGTGSGTSDSIPAMLSNGEFVINAKAAKGKERLLEMINSGKIASFAAGGAVTGKFYDYATGKNQTEERTYLDLSNIELMIETLDKSTDEWAKLVRLLDDAASVTKNLSYEEAKAQGSVADLNRALVRSSLATEELGVQTEQTTGSVRALGETTKKADEGMQKLMGGWAGTFQSFTGPLKQAAIDTSSFSDALKKGTKDLANAIQGKLLDKALKPIEQAADSVLNLLFGTTEDADGTSAAKALYVRMTGKAGESDVPLIEKAISGIGDFISNLFGGGGGSGMAAGPMDYLQKGSSGGSGGIGGFIGNLLGGPVGGFLGSLLPFAKGGMVPKPGMQPQYFASGGMAKGTDTVPAMLTPGEMVLNKGQQNAMMGGGVTINQTVNISEATNPEQFKQQLTKNNKIIVGMVQQSYNKRGQTGPQGYGQ